MSIDYVKSPVARLYEGPTENRVRAELLWGDRVVRTGAVEGERVEVSARGLKGWVSAVELGGEALLEVYFIDVGQGDGVLIVTPDRRHVLVDGGYKRSCQPLGKNAADFVDWKFAFDYGQTTIKLDCMIASHCDADHYGGLWDLLNVDQSQELKAKGVEVAAFYHAGVAWQVQPVTGKRWLGRSRGGGLVDLMSDGASIVTALEPDPSGVKLQGEWREFMEAVVAAVPVESIGRLSREVGYVPGFGPGDGKAQLKVLAPVTFLVDGRPAVTDYGTDSKNTNGNSIALRLDYGKCRILLTGDLNKVSQRALLEQWSGQEHEFACDVVKACHHGSDDVSLRFLKAMEPSATVISSGDNEGHAHPRPTVVAASALTGFRLEEDDAIKTPLVYSTEISRSVDFGKITKICAGGTSIDPENGGTIDFTRVTAGALKGQKGRRSLGGSYVVAGVVYGLVNVRTDGERVLCATLNETKYKWEWEMFDARH